MTHEPFPSSDRYAPRPPTVGSVRSAIACGLVAVDASGYLANGADDLTLLLDSGYALAAVDVVFEDGGGARFTRVLAVAEALVCEVRAGSRIVGYEPDRYGGVLLRVLPPYDRLLDAVRAGVLASRRAAVALDAMSLFETPH